MRQRSTIYVPTSSHDDFIQNINTTNFKVAAPSSDERFSIENKYTIPIKKPLQYIRQLRIQSKKSYDDIHPIFPFDFTTGLNIYVLPKNTINDDDNDEFFQELKSVVEDVIGIDINATEWITSANALYYYAPRSAQLKPQSSWIDDNIRELDSTFDLVYNADESAKQIILRQLITDVSEINYYLKLGEYKEIGLFFSDAKVSQTKDDVVLNGLRVILDGQSEAQDEQNDKIAHKTMFHVKPRHRYLPGSISSSIIPQGLHPILATTLSTENDLTSTINHEIIGVDADVETCNCYYYLNLNKSLIFDKYQNVPSNTTLLVNNGVSNLELPEYKIYQWGNELLFEINKAEAFGVSSPAKFDLNLTLHSRYQLPNNSDTLSPFTQIINPQPQLFIACQVKEGHLLSKSPFDSKRLSMLGNNHEAFFQNDTVFYYFNNIAPDQHLSVDISHGTTTFDRVNSITTFTILIGVGIIFWAILQKFTKSRVTAKQKSKTE
ncbi:PIG-X / PBN1 family protein [Candida parapsilosis]|uniref:Protein PBN1 n=2 Tax=Candida parapsilosis TaxID=5480 RepID=G8B5F6_CANPC|nr:uncharacterized protein CPAR2_602670 [Candida parapsilosis]KAF6043488.1 PIG-X / PBN1 family protein [Candida parapsilosis]KAF6044014.1 PIG-X / PBN1 family protein [Candida parapsilosis]KAF6045366.1 PIG-X / PBN1 family protein [Candida parapsilosis]KAF6060152.1 PIG-X / PBN1 family protein [Candida parapsilosis]KAI5901573.1 Protein PBN1 [Candida parapsilosis]